MSFTVLAVVTLVTIIAYGHSFTSRNWIVLTLRDQFLGHQRPRLSTANHTILMWTAFWASQTTDFLENCPAKDECQITYDRSRINDADAVVFHPPDVNRFDLPWWPSFRGQKFVVFLMESPLISKDDIRSLPESYFHWTMTHLNSSDVVSSYGGPWISKEAARQLGIPPLSLPYDKEEILRRKRVRGAVWFVSHCNTPSGRDVAVAALSRHFHVDVFGRCAGSSSFKNRCPRESNCEEYFHRYYFYIASENSICKDYITEKYWSRVHYPSIPVVMRRKIYERHLPPNSYIAMDDFEGPKEMAARLTYLMDHPDEYMSYFAWRKDGWIRRESVWMGMCNLCTKLVTHDYKQEDSSIADFEKWYASESECDDDSFATAWSQGRTPASLPSRHH